MGFSIEDLKAGLSIIVVSEYKNSPPLLLERGKPPNIKQVGGSNNASL